MYVKMEWNFLHFVLIYVTTYGLGFHIPIIMKIIRQSFYAKESEFLVLCQYLLNRFFFNY